MVGRFNVSDQRRKTNAKPTVPPFCPPHADSRPLKKDLQLSCRKSLWYLVPKRGLEPPRPLRALGPEPSASASSATSAHRLRAELIHPMRTYARSAKPSRMRI